MRCDLLNAYFPILTLYLISVYGGLSFHEKGESRGIECRKLIKVKAWNQQRFFFFWLTLV
uniref:Uncharacterized protein n=1 Tax=Rhizophora mucronata TaxID=61149 RepID=A0A2P2PEU8_RHIMU